MKIALLGQQKFGRTVLDAFLDRGHQVAAVFCAVDKPGSASDPIKIGAESKKIPVYQLPSLKSPAALDVLKGLDVELSVMAYVLQFVPDSFTRLPKHGTIQYHPSLLPRYRGASAINWPIIHGDESTGLTIFRPTDGLDEGPVILQKATPIGPDDTVGTVYFDRLFPMGVAALLEAAEMVVKGDVAGTVQDESQASYEGWCRTAESQINWHNHVDIVYNLVRGCDPSPGAWTSLNGTKLHLFDTRKHAVRRFAEVSGPIGTIAAIGERGFSVNAQGGTIEVQRVKWGDGPKLAAAKFCAEAKLNLGTVLGL